jgi:outer membrane immunogenic protein
MLTNHHLTEGVAMLRSTLAATVLMSLTIAGNADGFEHSSRAAVPAAWSWTGCYVGGNIGGLWDRSENWTVRTPGGAFFGQSLGGHDVDGWIGGVQAGCDYQFAGGFVIGAQGDYGWTNADGTHPSALETGVFYHSDVDSLASITGRIGYAWDRLLGYVKVGGAWGRVDYSASTILVGTAYTASDTRSGWTIGVGGEYALTDHLIGVIEYDYYDFGNERISLTPQIAGIPTGFLDIDESASVVRAGVNLRFGR